MAADRRYLQSQRSAVSFPGISGSRRAQGFHRQVLIALGWDVNHDIQTNPYPNASSARFIPERFCGLALPREMKSAFRSLSNVPIVILRMTAVTKVGPPHLKARLSVRNFPKRLSPTGRSASQTWWETLS